MSSSIIRLRPAPPLSLACGLLLWGWQTGFLAFAVPMAILLELPQWIRYRWPFSDREFNIVSDVSGLIFFLLVVYIFTKEGAGGIYRILAIMPFVLFLLILVQRYSVQGMVKLSVLFISLRRLDTDAVTEMDREIDLSLPYLVLCVLSASAGNRHPLLFFIILCLIFTAVLWHLRPGRYHAVTWTILLVCSLSIAYAGQIGIRHAQYSIEMMLMQVFEKYMWRYRDPDRATTAIGSLGRLKLSDRILLRVDTEDELDSPMLLREASYTNYGYGVWSNIDSNFQVIDPDITPGSWTLEDNRGKNTVAVSTYQIEEIGVVPLPHGTTNVYDITAFELNRNRYGAVRLETREGWIRYRADFHKDGIYDSPPDEYDLFIPEIYRADFERLANEWQLSGKNPSGILETVKRNFAGKFSYSLERRNRYPRGRYLHHFLFDNRQGHCEFFATSTVLLLRAAGIPARYAVGYSVNEYSELEDRYIVRARDAHSWALAFVDNKWRVIDTTPEIWAPLSKKDASALEPLFDLVAWLKFRYARWQSEDVFEEEGTDNDFLLWLLPPLIAFLLWRLYNRERAGRRQDDEAGVPGEQLLRPGSDSAMYRLIADLEKNGCFRRPGETLDCWFRRLEAEMNTSSVRQALDLHYRYRFDPEVNVTRTRARLAEIVEQLLVSDMFEREGQS